MNNAIWENVKVVQSTDENGATPEEFERLKAVIHAKRGQAALTSRNYEVALEDYLHLSELEPKSKDHQYRLAVAYTGTGKIDNAMAIFDKLIAKENNPSFYHGRAMAHFKSGNKASGFQDLDRAIALAPNNKNYPRIRAQIAAGMEVK